MKNLRITVIALFFGAAFAVSSCGPSACDCYEEGQKIMKGEEADEDMLKKCAEKYEAKDFEECVEKEGEEEKE